MESFWPKKLSHLLSPSNWRIFNSQMRISSQFASNILQLLIIPGRILFPPVIQLFRSKWLNFYQCNSFPPTRWGESAGPAKISQCNSFICGWWEGCPRRKALFQFTWHLVRVHSSNALSWTIRDHPRYSLYNARHPHFYVGRPPVGVHLLTCCNGIVNSATIRSNISASESYRTPSGELRRYSFKESN